MIGSAVRYKLESSLRVLYVGTVFTSCSSFVNAVHVIILQMTQMKLKDSRIKMMNEVLNGIKVCRYIHVVLYV